jgi:hypothetical protein
MSGAVAVLARPFARIPLMWRKQIGLALLVAAALLFPILHDNDADIDSMANAAAYATLALGLNIVVGFAGLLDLGYAAFFAIGAYTYGLLTSFQLEPPWSPIWEPLRQIGRVSQLAGDSGGFVVHFTLSFWLALPLAAAFAALGRRVRRPDASPARRLSGDRHARVRRDRADRGAQLVRPDRRRGGPQWRRRTEAAGLELRGGRDAVLLCRDRHGGAAGLHQPAIARIPYRTCLDGDPRG